jgi:hypothetical protein
VPRVLENLYNVFGHAAHRMFYYSRALGKQRLHARLMMSKLMKW